MTYLIEFEDKGQDLLKIEVNSETGIIEGAAPFHHKMYSDGTYKVDIGELLLDRRVHFEKDGKKKTFNWLMTKLSLDGKILVEVKQ